MLPESIAEELKIHLQRVKILHQQGLQKGYGSVYLPFTLERLGNYTSIAVMSTLLACLKSKQSLCKHLSQYRARKVRGRASQAGGAGVAGEAGGERCFQIYCCCNYLYFGNTVTMSVFKPEQ